VRPNVAVVGGGLAGLAAAYHLRKKANVTVFEAEARIGGRLLTSKRPRGEHGAEFVLGSEHAMQRLVRALGIGLDEIVDESWFRFKGNYSIGPIQHAARVLLPAQSARRVVRLVNRARTAATPPHDEPGVWVRARLGHDKGARGFVEMVLAGETCSPLIHTTARDVIGSLSPGKWYRIRHGSERLIVSLRRRCRAKVRRRARVTSVTEYKDHVSIEWTRDGRHHRTQCAAAILATPDGERLLGRGRKGRFHAYISVLLQFERAWWHDGPAPLREAFSGGLYMEGPLNYVQQVPVGLTRRPVLRVLMPNATGKLGSSNRTIAAFCLDRLRAIAPGVPAPVSTSVRRWEVGLPCRGQRSYVSSLGRLCLAGDQFAEWPSMDGAVGTGLAAARRIQQRLNC
jgi:hypothetical protein